MKVKHIHELVNHNKKVYIQTIIFTEKIEFNQELLNIIDTFPNLKTLEFESNTQFNSSCNDLINILCNSNICKIFIKFKNCMDLIWFSKYYESYNYKNTNIKKCWNTIRVFDFNYGNFNYDNLPNQINYLKINTQNKLELSNLPINLLKIVIESSFVNPILECHKWKIPFGCKVYFNDRLLNI